MMSEPMRFWVAMVQDRYADSDRVWALYSAERYDPQQVEEDLGRDGNMYPWMKFWLMEQPVQVCEIEGDA